MPKLSPEETKLFDEEFLKPREFEDIQLWNDECLQDRGSTGQIEKVKQFIAQSNERAEFKALNTFVDFVIEGDNLTASSQAYLQSEFALFLSRYYTKLQIEHLGEE